MKLYPNHLIGTKELSKDDILELVDIAGSFRKVLNQTVKSLPTLRGKTVVNLFFENSTRTRISFELAQQRLSCDIINFAASSSSIVKGESIKDTITNIEAMRVDAIVVRHTLSDLPRYIASFNDSVVINAGDGSNEHPTQALLDVFSLIQKLGKIEGKRVLILGDVKHSRVAKSNIYALKTLGASVAICGPATLLPCSPEILGVDSVYTDINEALKGVDAVNILRLQLERQKSGLFPSANEYRDFFALSRKRLDSIGKKIVIMHPGPMNRGVEITSEIADCEDSIILEQVTNGVAMRMAVLYKLLGGKSE